MTDVFVELQEFFWQIYGPVISALVVLFVVIGILATILILLDRIPSLLERGKPNRKGGD